MKRAALVVNSRSRRGKDWYDEAHKIVSAAPGIDLTYSMPFRQASSLIQRIKELKETHELILVGGGDGTISAAANILAHSPVTLGVLPLGTGNAFARDLGIPTDLKTAVDIAIGGNVADVDLGRLDGRYYVNVATMGLTTQIAQSLTVPMKRKLGRFVYAYAILRALQDLEPFDVVLKTANGRFECSAIQVVIGNGHYHAGPFPLSTTAGLQSGKQHLYIVESASKGNLLKFALFLPTGQQGLLREVHSEDVAEGKLVAYPSMSVTVDGEIIGRQAMEFSTDVAALRVAVPTNSPLVCERGNSTSNAQTATPNSPSG